MIIRSTAIAGFIALLGGASGALAGQADVTNVEIKYRGFTGYDFNVTVRHEEESPVHFVDRWEIVAPDGRILGTKRFTSAHVNEQPFTRMLSGVSIPPQIDRVTVRAHDTQHAFGGREVTVQVPKWDGHGRGSGNPLP
jgi:hypothetical protein